MVMSEEIKGLKEDVKFYKRLVEALMENAKSKPKSLKSILLKDLNEYLDIQDLQNVAKSLKFSTQYVQNVLNDKCNDNNVINALHTQALVNKELLLTSYQKMIDTLKK